MNSKAPAKPAEDRAAAAERILRSLAAEFPTLHDRQSFLESPALAAWFDAGPKGLSDNDRQSVSKALGRLIGDGTIGEVLWPRGNAGKIELPDRV